MSLSTQRIVSLFLPLLLLSAPHPAWAFKCWTNKEGVRECGNVVPPEYAQQETRTYSGRGVQTEVKQRAQTKEELAEEQRRKQEEQQRIAEEKKRRAAQAAKDRVLLMTFTSENDIISSRDRKLNAIDATIEITNVTIDKLKEKLGQRQKRAANLERAGKPIPEDLSKEMASLKKQIADKQNYIAAKRKNQDELRAKYDADLKRYREIANGQ